MNKAFVFCVCIPSTVSTLQLQHDADTTTGCRGGFVAVAHLEAHDAGVALLEVGAGVPVVFYVVQQLHMVEPVHIACKIVHDLSRCQCVLEEEGIDCEKHSISPLSFPTACLSYPPFHPCNDQEEPSVLAP